MPEGLYQTIVKATLAAVHGKDPTGELWPTTE